MFHDPSNGKKRPTVDMLEMIIAAAHTSLQNVFVHGDNVDDNDDDIDYDHSDGNLDEDAYI